MTRYAEVLAKFSTEVDKTQKVHKAQAALVIIVDSTLMFQVYQQHCRCPPLGQNMPPLSGKILWARQLLRHIEEIMDLLKVKTSLLLSNQGKAVVRKYNKMALVLTEYEILHYQSWIKIVDVCQRNVQVMDNVL